MNLAMQILPHIKNYFLSRFGSFSISEKSADCTNCLCSRENRMGLPFYRNDLKCCTFYPFIPNYVVGALLESPETPIFIKDLLKSKILNRVYALPMGLFVPLSYQIKFINREPQDFGNKVELLCPYFDKQKMNCGIWKYRGSVCTSYFCYSDYGKQGTEFWEILGEYLNACEMVLSQDCVVSRGLPPEIIDGQLEYINCATATSEELSSDSMSEAIFLSYWSEWTGSIEEFYRSCHYYVSNFSDQEMAELLSDETKELEEALKKKIKRIQSQA